MFAFKTVMAPLPNIEPVSVMIIALTAVFGVKSFVSVYIYVFCEIYFFGINVWNIMYLYVWAILTLIILLIRRPVLALNNRFTSKNGVIMIIFYSVVSSLYGLAFGTLCAIPYIFTFGWEFAVSWVVFGFWFDIMHCIGNACITAILIYPLFLLLKYAEKIFLKNKIKNIPKT